MSNCSVLNMHSSNHIHNYFGNEIDESFEYFWTGNMIQNNSAYSNQDICKNIRNITSSIDIVPITMMYC
jgi:hypothetical protein